MVTAFILSIGVVLTLLFSALILLYLLAPLFSKLQSVILMLVSFSVGTLFANAFFHLIPESLMHLSWNMTATLILTGIVVFFVIEKFIHWRHCHVLPGGHHEHSHPHEKPFVLTNLMGDLIHNMIDGMIIASAFIVSIPLGIATSLAIFIHEIPHELGNCAVLLHGGMKISKAILTNSLMGLGGIAGVLITFGLSQSIPHFEIYLIPIAAGSFIYLAGSDLIPELHEQTELHFAVKQLMMMVLGIFLIAAIR